MRYTLRLNIGGLCLIVDERKGVAASKQHPKLGPGLYVVMPRSSEVKHIPTVYYRNKSKYGEDARSPDDWTGEPLTGRMYDYFELATSGKKQTVMPGRFAEMSRCVGDHCVVDAACLVGASSRHAVIRLPLPQRPVEPHGDFAKLIFTGAHPETKSVAGIARIEYDVDDGVPDFQVGKTVLRPVSGLLEVTFANLPPNAGSSKLQPGDEVMHVQAYYSLLRHNGKMLPGGPKVFVYENSPKNHWVSVGPKPSRKRGPSNNTDIRWIVPEECTVGTAAAASTAVRS